MTSEIMTSARLRLRALEPTDADALTGVLCDADAMRWYPRPYSRQEVDTWILRNRERYRVDGFGLWAVEWSADGSLVGDCGLVSQPLDGARAVEVGYHVLPAWQGRGIATEAAGLCRDYARDRLHLSKLHAFVRPGNEASRRVAANIGMRLERSLEWGSAKYLHEIWVIEFT